MMSKDDAHNVSECHDPNCGCHHEHHDHHFEHHDHHEHDHGAENGSLASSLINNSMVMSRNWHIQTITPVTCAEIEERFRKDFLRIGDLLAVDGVILGHLKGTVKVQSGAFITFSVTRQGEIDMSPSEDWIISDSTNSISVIINILSVQRVNLSLEQFFDFNEASLK